jgi:general secretion pathway protein G
MEEAPIPPRPSFSLGKILIVAGIVGAIGILGLVVAATLFVPRVLAKFSVAKQGKVRVDVISIQEAARDYSMRNGGTWPESLAVLVVPDTNGHTYLKSTAVPRDPWGNEYFYEPPQRPGDRPIVRSLGRDGKPGGEGEDADIDSESERR